MLALVLVSLVASASAQECIKDNRLKALNKADFQAREQTLGFSKDGMWKMPKLAQHATEEQLEDCASCTDAEVQVQLMQAQLGEDPRLNELHAVHYPIPAQYKETGVKLIWKEMKREAPQRVMDLLRKRSESRETSLSSYRQWKEDDITAFVRNKEEMSHLAPEGLGPYFSQLTDKKKNPSAAAKREFAEYITQVRLLKDIEKSSTKGSGNFLVLKEGMVMGNHFMSKYKKAIEKAPQDWDILFLRTGPSAENKVRCEDKVGDSNIFEMRRPVTTPDGKNRFYQHIDGYVIRQQSLSKINNMIFTSKAAPLNELFMSVHNEEQERLSNGKINYKADGIYAYEVSDSLLAFDEQAAKASAPPVVKATAKKSLLQTV